RVQPTHIPRLEREHQHRGVEHESLPRGHQPYRAGPDRQPLARRARRRGTHGAGGGVGDSPMPVPQTLFEKVWRRHEVLAETPDTPAVLYIDLHLIHEVT